jgi:hypothetical protein
MDTDLEIKLEIRMREEIERLLAGIEAGKDGGRTAGVIPFAVAPLIYGASSLRRMCLNSVHMGFPA